MKPLSDATAKIFRPIVGIRPTDTCVLTADETGRLFAADFFDRGRGRAASGQQITDAPSRAVSKTLIERMPERKKLSSYGGKITYELPITDTTCNLLQALLPAPDQLQFNDTATEALFLTTIQNSLIADYCAELNADWKINRKVPDDGFGLQFPAEPDLHYPDYQQLAVAMGMYSDGFGYFMEQGTGKTPVGIAVVCNATMRLIRQAIAEALQPRMLRVLIVSPNNVRMNWEYEFAKFATVGGKVTVIRGEAIGRVRQVIDAMTDEEGCDFTAVVCGYETMTKSLESLAMVHWDIIVLDEAHYIKSVATKRFKSALVLRDRCDKRLVLTGTPIANSVLDLYALLEFMGEGYSGFSSFKAFKNFYGIFEDTQHRQTMVCVQNLPFMQERLSQRSFIISLQEAQPDLPPKVYDVCEVEMSEQQRDFYREVATKVAIEIERELTSDKMARSMIVNNALVKLLRLTQITSGFMSWGAEFGPDGEPTTGSRIEYFYPNPKLEQLCNLIEEDLRNPDDKISVWSCFNASIDEIARALNHMGVDFVEYRGATSDEQREQNVWRFNNDPACRLFLANGAAGGTGLNLLGYPPGRGDDFTTNHSHCIVYDQNHSAIIRGQLEARGHRRGTRKPYRVTDLIVPKSYDEEIRMRVTQKQLRALEVSDLRAILQGVYKTLESI